MIIYKGRPWNIPRDVIDLCPDVVMKLYWSRRWNRTHIRVEGCELRRRGKAPFMVMLTDLRGITFGVLLWFSCVQRQGGDEWWPRGRSACGGGRVRVDKYETAGMAPFGRTVRRWDITPQGALRGLTFVTWSPRVWSSIVILLCRVRFVWLVGCVRWLWRYDIPGDWRNVSRRVSAPEGGQAGVPLPEVNRHYFLTTKKGFDVPTI